MFGSADLVRVLLGAKAEIEGKNDKGNTAIAIAAATGVVDVVRVLIEYNADPTVVNNEGKGILQKARDSSGTMESMLVQSHNPPMFVAVFRAVKELSRHVSCATCVMFLCVAIRRNSQAHSQAYVLRAHSQAQFAHMNVWGSPPRF